MVMMAGFDLPVRAIREQIASAVDLIIQTARMRDGSRKVAPISEIVGMEGDVVTMQEIVRFAQHGVDDGQSRRRRVPVHGRAADVASALRGIRHRYDVRKLSDARIGKFAMVGR